MCTPVLKVLFADGASLTYTQTEIILIKNIAAWLVCCINKAMLKCHSQTLYWYAFLRKLFKYFTADSKTYNIHVKCSKMFDCLERNVHSNYPFHKFCYGIHITELDYDAIKVYIVAFSIS